MANHKSAKKRSRQSLTKRDHNRANRSRTRTVMKAVRSAISDNKKEEAQTLLVKAQSLLAKSGKTGALNSKTSARLTSRLTLEVNKL